MSTTPSTTQMLETSHGSQHAPEQTSAPQVFRREGEYWTVGFDGTLCRLKHTRGMEHLAQLLSHPGERIPAIELNDPHGIPSVAAAERARVNVTRQIVSVLKRIAEHHPTLAAHLGSTIRTGSHCSYTPDSRLPVRWEM